MDNMLYKKRKPHQPKIMAGGAINKEAIIINSAWLHLLLLSRSSPNKFGL